MAPLLQPDMDEASAVRFDALMYGIELAYIVGKKYAKARTDLFKKSVVWQMWPISRKPGLSRN